MEKNLRVLLAAGSLAAVVLGGCVQNRPSRNGVFNENQYVRKSFLVAPGDGSQQDSGWMMKTTVTAVSTPNPLGSQLILYPGLENGGSFVRFQVTEDHLNLINMRELTSVPSDQRTPEIVNSWPITNVDLKYRVDLDGQTTNFLEENQELDWQVRQWVKLKWAKNDMSDVAPFGPYLNDLINKCTDAVNISTTLVPNSFVVDETNNYMEFTISITAALIWNDASCTMLYGDFGNEAQLLGRQDVTFNVKYSFNRMLPMSKVTYTPLTMAEKDPIRHKYGVINYTTIDRDNASGLLAARQLAMRFDPTKPIVWYFANGFPDNYKAFFTDNGGPADTAMCGTAACSTVTCQTNCLLKDSGATARLSFKNFDADLAPGQAPRQYGDVRYNFLVWMNDRDTQGYFAGSTQFVTDPRTGETLSASIVLNDFSIQDYYVQRLDAYLQGLGASAGINSAGDWPQPGQPGGPPANCKDGDTLPIVPATVVAVHDANSSVYAKMQQYLQKPVATYGNLGPQDFIVDHTQDPGGAADFYRAYFALIPYQIFADPDANQFVIREGGQGVYGPGSIWKIIQDETSFQQAAAKIDQGLDPYDTTATGAAGVQAMSGFLNNWKQLTLAHQKYEYSKSMVNRAMGRFLDEPTSFSFENIIARDARHCVKGQWETKQQWVQNLIDTYWSQVAWHEFGHALGLEHNFMASVDQPNFPQYTDAAGRTHYGLYASSVMEYNAEPDRVFWHAGWAPYDQGAISFIYANSDVSCSTDADCQKSNMSSSCQLPTGATSCPQGTTCTCDRGQPGASVSGQSGLASGSAPWKDPHGFSADGKNEIQYLYCNETHELYTPLCRAGDMGVTPSEIIANEIENYEWQYKWSNFRQYRKFWDNSGYANVPAGLITDMRKFLSLWAFDWSTGELADTLRRIGITNPDPNGSDLEYYTQLTNKFNQEISQANQMVGAFHKAIIQQSSGERPYRTIYDKFFGDVTQQGIILDKLFAMQGWVGLWPTTNYDPNQAGGYIASYSGMGDSSYEYIAEDAVTSMIGGQYDVYPYFVPLAVAQFAQDTHAPEFGGRIEIRDWIGGHVFYRLQDFLDYFRDIAVQNNVPGCDNISDCTYDPRPLSDTHNVFIGPDKRQWIWAYIADRNQWVAAQKDRNIATYVIIRNYTDDVIYQLDDGAFPGGAYGAELPMKYFLDSFNMYN